MNKLYSRSNKFSIMGFAIILMLLISSVSFAQLKGSDKQIDSLILVVQSYRDKIKGKLSELSVIEDFNMVPILKLKYLAGKRERQLSIVPDLHYLCVTDKNRKKIYVYDVRRDELGIKGVTAANGLGLLERNKKGKRVFFGYFMASDWHLLDILVVSQYGESVFNFGAASDLSVEEVLNRKYGSVLDYSLYITNEERQSHVRKSSIERFKDFEIKDNWHFYSKYFPTDTLNSISLLSKNIEESLSPTINEMDFFKKELQKFLLDTAHFRFVLDERTRMDLRYRYPRSVVFMGKNIAPILKKCFGLQKFNKFQIEYQVVSNVSAMVEGSLIARYKGNWKDVREFVKKNIVVTNVHPITYRIKNESRNPYSRVTLWDY